MFGKTRMLLLSLFCVVLIQFVNSTPVELSREKRTLDFLSSRHWARIHETLRSSMPTIPKPILSFFEDDDITSLERRVSELENQHWRLFTLIRKLQGSLKCPQLSNIQADPDSDSTKSSLDQSLLVPQDSLRESESSTRITTQLTNIEKSQLQTTTESHEENHERDSELEVLPTPLENNQQKTTPDIQLIPTEIHQPTRSQSITKTDSQLLSAKNSHAVTSELETTELHKILSKKSQLENQEEPSILTQLENQQSFVTHEVPTRPTSIYSTNEILKRSIQ